MKILIVDDSKAMRMIVRRTLRHAGYGGHQILEAADGAIALAVVASERPDLVLSGWNMSELSGIELLQALRDKGTRVQFGFVTSESTDVMRELARAAGALFLIAKPFTADAFAHALDAALAS